MCSRFLNNRVKAAVKLGGSRFAFLVVFVELLENPLQGGAEFVDSLLEGAAVVLAFAARDVFFGLVDVERVRLDLGALESRLDPDARERTEA